MEYARPIQNLLSRYGGSYPTQSGFTMPGVDWVTDPEGYIDIGGPGSFYWEVEYTNTSGNKLYVGWEQFDSAKTPTSNDSCFYVVNTTGGYNRRVEKGVANITTAGGNPVRYIKLRILNSWEGTSGTATIHFLSLRSKGSTTTTFSVEKNGIVVSDSFRTEDGICRAYKNGFTSANDFYEI